MNDEYNGIIHDTDVAENAPQPDKNIECQKELAQLKERYAYLMSDFENHRRREEKERMALLQRIQSSFLVELLPLVDDFERAFKGHVDQDARDTKFTEGFALIQKSLLKILEKYGVTQMTQNETFDPHFHEALLYVAQEGKASGAIVEVLQKGYMLRGQVLRPAQVSVAQ